jgi:hypothetical protein
MPVLVVLVTLAQVVRHTMVQAVLPTLAQEALVMPDRAGPLTMVRVAHATAAQVVQHIPVPADLATTGLADLAIQVQAEAEAAAVQQSVGDAQQQGTRVQSRSQRPSLEKA